MAPHLGQYIRMFGTFKGVEVYARAKYGRHELILNVPGFRGPIRLRGKTSDRPTFQKIFLDREYEFDWGGAPRVIIDGGANVGYAAVYFAQKFSDALVIAVEPEANNFRLLKHNTSLYPNVRPVNKALWPRRTNLIIENPSDQPHAFRVRETTQATANTIPATTIQELLHEVGANSVDLLKLDIEGAEKELFEDNTSADWLTRTHALIVELHDRFKPGCTAAVERAVANQNFRRSQAGESLVFVRETRH